MTRNVRPMLAAQKYREAGDLWGPLHEQVVATRLERGPLIMQPKIDGMRCILLEGQARSRSFKLLGNQALQAFARDHTHLNGLDGEVFSGHDYSGESFRRSMSGVRAASGDGDLTIVFFDHVANPQYDYHGRKNTALLQVGGSERLIEGYTYRVKLLECPQREVSTLGEIYAYETELLEAGWEGGIIRDPLRPYKFGRSTALDMALVKVKRRDTVDARVVGYEPRYENQNEAFQNELGYTSRSAHKEGKVPLEMLGALHLELLDGSNVRTKCGVFRGLTHTDLRDLWAIKDTLEGRYCEVSVDKATGGYDSARTPVWLRWRDASEF